MKTKTLAVHFVAFLFLLGLAASAEATDRWYGDSKAASPDNHYEISATSPENRKKDPEPFQRNFTFSLLDRRTDKKLWSFNDGKDGEPPKSLYISNSGQAVILGGYNSLGQVRPNGERIKLPRIFDLIPETEEKKYCDDTSAGTFWSQFSWQSFTEIEKKEYFYIRTYWGRYMIIDLEAGKMTEDKAIQKRIEDDVYQEAKKIFDIPQSKYRIWCAHCQMMENNPLISRGIFVLVQHNEPKIQQFVDLIMKADDPIMPDAKEYLPRLLSK